MTRRNRIDGVRVIERLGLAALVLALLVALAPSVRALDCEGISP